MENNQQKDTYLLLGPQEVGKTCFMAGLYYSFRSALSGFSISCSDETQRMSLDVMCKELSNGDFPPGTGGSTTYPFILRYGHKERFRFNWYDYRGKVVEEYGLENEDEYEDLARIVNESTCILVCVDGTWLSNDKEKTVKTIQDNVYSLNPFFDRYMDEKGTLPPICIVITKYDTCEAKYKQKYFDAIRESFPFFSIKVPIFICPICIGTKDDSKGVFIFDPNDKDVYRPLFFALWCGYGQRIEKQIEDYEHKKHVYSMTQKYLKKEIDKLNDRIIVFNRESRVAEKQKEIKKMDTALSKLKKDIESSINEREQLLDCISASKDIYLGLDGADWEDLRNIWKCSL
ncbi:TRAFAC clade GTPase domain-containing protein [Butyrivibrio sp. NC2007]|uniref:TRAFAC clade GTPase domain-containing protein n=1 Tax=Butyrivibrio sp. NC2007 TaxID=1280683 RepID=UPI0003B5A6B7|nr:hypothetical protein [Butyrivibrio sp. NC2007]